MSMVYNFYHLFSLFATFCEEIALPTAEFFTICTEIIAVGDNLSSFILDRTVILPSFILFVSVVVNFIAIVKNKPFMALSALISYHGQSILSSASGASSPPGIH